MANIDLINNDFIQHGPICALASYSVIIEYYSNKDILIENVLTRFQNKFKISVFYLKGQFLKAKHNAISKDFHEVQCYPKNMRGFDFIKNIHEDDSLETKKYCQIIDSEASLVPINEDKKAKIKKEIVENGGLAMILYKVNANLYHAVIIGYDPESESISIKILRIEIIDSVSY